MSQLPRPFVFQAYKDLDTGNYHVSPTVDTLANNVPVSTDGDPTRLIVPSENDFGWRWAPYGQDDLLPTIIREKVEQVSMAGQTMYRLMAMMYGNGLMYYKNSDLAKGANVERAYIPEVEEWLARNQINQRWLLPQFLNYRYLTSTFSEMIFNKRRDYVTGIFHLEGEFCRKSRQDPRSLRSEYLYYSADFASRFHGSLTHGQAIPLFDWQRPEQSLAKMAAGGGYKMAWHSHLPTFGMIHYPTPPWVALFKKKGWMDVAAAVPQIVDSLQRNQMKLVYQISIPTSYFNARYPEWNNYDAKKKSELMDEISLFLQNELSDTGNAGKSIVTFFDTGRDGTPLGKIEITAIDDKLKRDSWVPSSNAANAEIVQGLGLHPSQLGLGPDGGPLGAGSGSDQREGFNTANNVNTLEQEIVLSLANWAARFNRWDITFKMDHTFHTTTNNQEDGQVPSATTITTE